MFSFLFCPDSLSDKDVAATTARSLSTKDSFILVAEGTNAPEIVNGSFIRYANEAYVVMLADGHRLVILLAKDVKMVEVFAK